MLIVAVPKGRVLTALAPVLGRMGIDPAPLLADDRTLVRESGELRFLLLKPDDVPTYVEYGAADLGICGRDVLDERGADLYRPLDLGIGRCRLVVAGPKDLVDVPARPRVATKYPKTAAMHFARRGMQPEIVYVQGSVELAPITGLADLIVDLVESGATLDQNGLVVREIITEVTSVVVANRASYKLRHDDVRAFLAGMRRGLSEG